MKEKFPHSRKPSNRQVCGEFWNLRRQHNTLLSSQVATGISWSPLSGLKGVKPPVKFGEKTRDCSPSQAGKEVPNLAMTVGFPELRRQCGVSHEV